MFRCDVCGSVAPPNTRCNRLVVETRPVDYSACERAYCKPRPRRRNGKDKWIADPGGSGTEIVREIRACEQCAAKAMALERRGKPAVDETMRPIEKLAS